MKEFVWLCFKLYVGFYVALFIGMFILGMMSGYQ